MVDSVPKGEFACAREAAQGLGALTTVPEDEGSLPSAHMGANSHLQLQFQGIQNHPLAAKDTAHMWYTGIHAGKTPIFINKK